MIVRSGFFTGNHNMTRKNPDKRTAKRLQKLEDEKQALKVKICQFRIEGMSLRDIASKVGLSHQAVYNICDLLLSIKTPARMIAVRGPRGGKRLRRVGPVRAFKEGYRSLLPSKRPGPRPGRTPKCDEIEDMVVNVRKRYDFLGAEKIGVIAGVSASAPTVRKTLRRCGFGNITKKKGQPRKRFCAACPNDMWQIDYVDLGSGTHLLSVIDDHSRKILSKNLSHSCSTDDVLAIIGEAVRRHGAPKAILSDHGVQWYSTRGGDSRFDEFCAEMGIKHYMGGICRPTTQGKVERWHGSIRRETGIDSIDDIEEKRSILYDYIDFYNRIRPHYGVGLRTPDAVFDKTAVPEPDPIALYVLQ
jgi:putative transposase